MVFSSAVECVGGLGSVEYDEDGERRFGKNRSAMLAYCLKILRKPIEMSLLRSCLTCDQDSNPKPGAHRTGIVITGARL